MYFAYVFLCVWVCMSANVCVYVQKEWRAELTERKAAQDVAEPEAPEDG